MFENRKATSFAAFALTLLSFGCSKNNLPSKADASSTNGGDSSHSNLQDSLRDLGHPLAKTSALTWSQWSDYCKKVYERSGFTDSADKAEQNHLTLVDQFDFRREMLEKFNLELVNGLAETWLVQSGAELNETVRADKQAKIEFVRALRPVLKDKHGNNPLTLEAAREEINEYAAAHASSFLPEGLKDKKVKFEIYDVRELVGDAVQIAADTGPKSVAPEELFKGVTLPARPAQQ
jgi:hypothetical protein